MTTKGARKQNTAKTKHGELDNHLNFLSMYKI